MKLTTLAGALSLPLTTLALPSCPFKSTPTNPKKAEEAKAGYLAVYWTTEDESVYYALSPNDNPLGFKSINGGNPIVSPTLGTKAIRDTTIIRGAGADEGKYWIIGTDLNIDTVLSSPRDPFSLGSS